MRSLILSSALFCTVFAAPPARAEELVTTSETDGSEPDFQLVIVQPLDGEKFEGTPDAKVTLIAEFDPYFLGSAWTQVDDEEPVVCDLEPCQRELVLAPGQHVLRAWHEWDEATVTVTVNASGETGETEGSETETGAATEATGETDPGEPTSTSQPTSTSDNATDGGETDASDTDAGGSGDKEGCGCKADPGLPDLLGLALFALLVPWRRRRA